MPEENKPMISTEYRKEYAKREPDWLRKFVANQCYVEETLPEGSKKKPKVVADLNLMVKLAIANNMGDKAAGFRDGSLNNGQKIMNINNMLRAAARKRHGLFSIDGKWVKADAEFVKDHDRTEDKDGTKLAVKKDKEQAAA